MQNDINSNKYILNIKFGELSEFGTPCQSLVTNSSAIPEESNHSGAITSVWMESVGHCKVLRKCCIPQLGMSTDG
jgi:hypothetical protein